MSDHDLTSDSGLRAACDALSRPDTWEESRRRWVRELAETFRWVKAASAQERESREFQQRLWEENHIAAVGQGNISVDGALQDPEFRRWLAGISTRSLPAPGNERLTFLTGLYEELKEHIEPFVARIPHLKIFRVMAALYPEAMTSVADRGALEKLVRAMGGERRLSPAERHAWVRKRIDDLLGPPGADLEALGKRISLPWMLYAFFVQKSLEQSHSAPNPEASDRLLPLPAARRRRGLTPIRGLFPGALSVLEFVRTGVTREELLDFLRAASPDAKTATLRMTINVLESELGAIRVDQERYVLSDRGEKALATQDAVHLADWILTRILGADKAIVELRDGKSLAPVDLVAAVRSMNPGWKTDFVPQSILNWLRSMGVIETDARARHALTDAGLEWASRIDWQPEALPPDPEIIVAPVGDVVLPTLTDILERVQGAGHFPTQLIARLHTSLWSHARRHFAILSGLSGSGKTLLARRYAKAVTGEGLERQLFTLPVQPGWYDPGALLGFTNPLRADSYVRTGFLDFLIAAVGDPQHPYVVVLDEMNLSHPEQYMSPLLSAMETEDAIRLHTEDDLLDGVPASIPYPRNLVIIGTVNMDETTHGLSDKVLDRAFVLDFWEIDLDAYPGWGTRNLDPTHESRARAVLTELMQALSPARLHFGWRVVDEVLDFLTKAATTGEALPFASALDDVIYAKVLPKLRGEDAPRFQDALNACEASLAKFGLAGSRDKVAELKRELAATGSARFWR